MKKVIITLGNQSVLEFNEIGSYQALKDKYRPGKELPLNLSIGFGPYEIIGTDINPVGIRFEPNQKEPKRAYEGKLTYAKLCDLIQKTDFSKLDYSNGYENTGAVYWDDLKQCFKACKYHHVPMGRFYIFVGWSGSSGLRPYIAKFEAKIKRYHTKEYEEPSFIGVGVPA